MNFFGVGPGEAFLVLVIALLVVGPDRVPEVARQAARYYKLARRYTDEVMKDVRAAVDELELEVGEPGEDLKSIREIGSSLAADLRSAGADLDRAGADTKATLEATASDVDAAAAPVATAPAPAADATPAATDAPATEAPAESEPAAANEPVSFRPSKRAAAKAPSDPFAALEAKRARDRERGGVEPPAANGQ
jgi:sec-independent protein translocase protein TatB